MLMQITSEFPQLLNHKNIIINMRTVSSVLLFVIFSAGCENTTNQTFQFTAGNHDLEGALVYTDLEIEDASDTFCLEVSDELIPAQTEQLSSNSNVVRVWWQANLSADETKEYSIHNQQSCSDSEYTWQRTGDQSIQLQYKDQPLIQYEHPVFDSDNIEETKKPFIMYMIPHQGK